MVVEKKDRCAQRLKMLFLVEYRLATGESGVLRVRNLSDSNLGAEIGDEWSPITGQRVTITFRDETIVEGHVARLDGRQVAIAFDQRIDTVSLHPITAGRVDLHHVPERFRPSESGARPSLVSKVCSEIGLSGVSG